MIKDLQIILTVLKCLFLTELVCSNQGANEVHILHLIAVPLCLEWPPRPSFGLRAFFKSALLQSLDTYLSYRLFYPEFVCLLPLGVIILLASKFPETWKFVLMAPLNSG